MRFMFKTDYEDDIRLFPHQRLRHLLRHSAGAAC